MIKLLKIDILTTDCPFNDIIPGILQKIRSKRKNLKLVLSTSRPLDLQKYAQILSPSTPPPIITLPSKLPFSLHSLPPQALIYLSSSPLFKPTPRIFYLEKPTFNYLEKAVETAYSIHAMAKGEGDVVVWVTGPTEISAFGDKLEVSYD